MYTKHCFLYSAQLHIQGGIKSETLNICSAVVLSDVCFNLLREHSFQLLPGILFTIFVQCKNCQANMLNKDVTDDVTIYSMSTKSHNYNKFQYCLQ